MNRAGAPPPDLPDWMHDHAFLGRAVLPAVASLDILENAVRRAGHTGPLTVREADFPHFLPLPPAGEPLAAFPELTWGADGTVTAVLKSRLSTPSGITREKEHARAVFSPAPAPDAPPLDTLAALQGFCRTFPARDLYRDMVPFGPAFYNLLGEVRLSRQGALGEVRAPEEAGEWAGGLALDAAFHLASAWGQWTRGITAFPLGFGLLHRPLPIRPGERLRALVRPAEPGQTARPGEMLFDLWLMDHEGRLRAACRGLRLADPSRGRLKPPAWLGSPGGDDLLNLCPGLLDLVVLELSTLASFAPDCLSPRERLRLADLGPRRRPSFLASRLALKLLARRLAPELGLPGDLPAQEMDTLAADPVLPIFPLPAFGVRVSVSHDSRYCLAAAARGPVGVDLEETAPRALRGAAKFLDPGEMDLIRAWEGGPEEGATLAWTIKEALAKASGLGMAHTAGLARAVSLGRSESRIELRGTTYPARHAFIRGRILTVLAPPLDFPPALG